MVGLALEDGWNEGSSSLALEGEDDLAVQRRRRHGLAVTPSTLDREH